MTPPPLFSRVALIGLGLIGSSLARLLKREGLAGHIVGCARTEATRKKALELGFVDSVTEQPGAAADGADLVVMCAPVGTYAALGEAIAPHLKPGAILTDVGSAKQSVIRDLGPAVPAFGNRG